MPTFIHFTHHVQSYTGKFRFRLRLATGLFKQSNIAKERVHCGYQNGENSKKTREGSWLHFLIDEGIILLQASQHWKSASKEISRAS